MPHGLPTGTTVLFSTDHMGLKLPYESQAWHWGDWPWVPGQSLRLTCTCVYDGKYTHASYTCTIRIMPLNIHHYCSVCNMSGVGIFYYASTNPYKQIMHLAVKVTALMMPLMEVIQQKWSRGERRGSQHYRWGRDLNQNMMPLPDFSRSSVGYFVYLYAP